MSRLQKQRYYVFLLPFLLYFIPRYIQNTTLIGLPGVAAAAGLLKLAAYMLAVVLLCLKGLQRLRVNSRYLAAGTVLLGYLAFEGFVLGHKSLFVVFLFALTFPEKELDRYVRLVFSMSAVMYLLTVLLAMVGAIPNVMTERLKFGSIWQAYGMGFTYSGQMMMMLIPLVFLYCYIRKDALQWWETLALLAVSAAVYAVSRTIMPFALILLFIVLFNLVRWQRVHGRRRVLLRVLQNRRIALVPAAGLTITVLLLLVYRFVPFLGEPLDRLCNGRFSLGVRMISIYGIRLLGTGFVNRAGEGYYEFLDSEYMHMLVSEGVLYLAVAVVLGVLIMRWAQRRGDVYLTLIWTMVFLNAVVNNGIYDLVMNPFGIVLAAGVKDKLQKTRKAAAATVPAQGNVQTVGCPFLGVEQAGEQKQERKY